MAACNADTVRLHNPLRQSGGSPTGRATDAYWLSGITYTLATDALSFQLIWERQMYRTADALPLACKDSKELLGYE